MTVAANGQSSTVDAGGMADRALEWIHANYRAFQATGPKLLELRAAASREAYYANRDGEAERAAAAKEVSRNLADLYTRWAYTYEQAKWVVGKVPGLGLNGWVVPIGVSAVALAVFVAGAKIMREADLQERALELVASGDLTADEARELGLDLGGSGLPSLPSFGIGGLTGALLAVGGLWWLSTRQGGR